MKLISAFQKLITESQKKKDYYLAYTVLFFVLTFFCFSWFIFSGKSLIWETDGWNQHFKALVYYGQYLRSIIKTLLFKHKLIIPNWDFCIGEGSDVVGTFHYYVIGDPIALLSVFVPTRFMHYLFSASCILRLYLSGIAFSELCFGTDRKDRCSILAGALSYSFCIWGLYLVARHPYFVNPMIYFPLMILGMEKIIRRESPYLFIITTAVSAASNFYFFYMIVLATVGYAVVRLGLKYCTDIRTGVKILFCLGGYALIGVMMACIILLPVLMMALKDSRLSGSQPFHLFYPLIYYSQLPSIILSNQGRYWLHIGMTAPTIFAIVLLFHEKKKNTLLKVLFVLCALIVLFPIGGRIFNGMSYMTNRWCWVFILLCSYILVCEWDSLLSVTPEKWRLLFASAILFFAFCLFLEGSRNVTAFAAVPLLFISLIVAADKLAVPGVKKEIRSLLLLLIIMVGLANTAFWHFAPGAGNYVSEFKENKKIPEEWESNEAVAVKALASGRFTRFSGRSLTHNVNAVQKVSSTQYSWSLSNPYVNRYRSLMEVREPSYFSFQGYDDRTALVTLAAVQYFVVREKENIRIPYGFIEDSIVNTDIATPLRLEELKRELHTNELTDAQKAKIETALKNKFIIYRNEHALPFGYCYDSIISPESWIKMDPVQKQENLLSAAYVGKDLNSDLSIADVSLTDYTIPFEVRCKGNEVTKSDSGFITTSDKTKIELKLEKEIRNAEVYVELEGIKFAATPEYDLYFGDESVDPLNLYNRTNWDILPHSSQVSMRLGKYNRNPVVNATFLVESSAGQYKQIVYKQPDEAMSSGRDTFIANLGYTEEPVSSITITLPTMGVYTFKNIRVYYVPMDGYEEKIAKLQENKLTKVKIGIDYLSGEIEAPAPRMLCVAIPYSDGWKGTIDGEEAEVHCINEHYLGMYVPEGKHDIYLHYQTPYNREGALISLLGAVALFAVCLFERKKRCRAGQ